MSDQNWIPARLIPVSGIGGPEERERRATSALLAVLGAVDEFGAALLRPLGAPAGAVSTFCEVPFLLVDGQKVRVDGAIRVRRGIREWTVLVEVKTGNNELSREQIETYLEVVKEHNLGGLLTISNQIAAYGSHHPVHVDGRRFGRTPLFHLSWTRILAIAHMVHQHQGVSDPDQAWILSELIRYLEYEGSGALAFDDMGPSWVEVRTAAANQTLRTTDDGVADITARWDQFIQYLCLGLGARLGREVRPVFLRREADPSARAAALAHQLADAGLLSGAIKIPDTVGSVQMTVNLRHIGRFRLNRNCRAGSQTPLRQSELAPAAAA